jgi:hypothetical protein
MTHEQALAHFGIKGMHWGQRKAVTPAQRIRQIQVEKDKFSGQRIVDGAGLKGWAINKGSKHPTARAITSVSLRGAFEVGVILGGGKLLLDHVSASPKAKQGAAIGIAMLAGQVGLTRINQIRDVRQFNAHDKLIKEEAALRKQLAAQSKAHAKARSK